MGKNASKESKDRWLELYKKAEAAGAKDFITEGVKLILRRHDWHSGGDGDWDAAYQVGIGYLETALGLVEIGMVGADEYDEIIAAQDLMREA